VISRIATRPPGRSTRRSSAEPTLEIVEVADAEADRGGVERAVLERQRERVALHPLDLRRLASPARASAPRSRARSRGPGLQRRDREVAGAAAGVEHAVAGRTIAATVARRQRWSSPIVIVRFIAS
jgi:hypothetical protein